MGGKGSGFQGEARQVIGGAFHYDATELKKRGLIYPEWPYASLPPGAPVVDQVQVPVNWQPFNFGGSRAVFICPKCNKNARILYGLSQCDRKLACRKCKDLAYKSNQNNHSALARASDQVVKIREKLKVGLFMRSPFFQGEIVWPKRPKGMHQSTYERLSAELEEAYETLLDAL